MPLRDIDRDDDLAASGHEKRRGQAGLRHGSPDREAWERNRLAASIALFAGAGFLLALPFALRAGAEFFLPLTAALVIAVCLVPLLEWLERRRIPSPLAALLALSAFLFVANTALVLIVVPASDWITQLPDRISQIKITLEPVIRLYTQAQGFIDGLLRMVTETQDIANGPGNIAMPGSLLQMMTTAAPGVVINVLFGLLVIFFFLSGWTRLRHRTIRGRGSFTGALTIARVIQNVVDATSRYVLTITFINMGLGLTVALALMLMGMPTPFMWGGFVALLNFIPYFGPIIAAILLGLGGLMSFTTVGWALLPAIIMVCLHLIEANIVTPLVLGERLKVNPLLILVSLSFWTWVWGTAGALLAVPLLIIIQTVLAAAGKPDIAGFLFEAGTLTSTMHDAPTDYDER
ncbi:AI-2E family transporter [Sphingobium lignivorans]|uniref:PurR-regulated permease PerM n=1 Tax=Sphingobium lignivorans TaxID=2735886 RepID=A0ABR6NG49_9SPHN|nr:AI-2E family transporter [Sphingobium lignivorans]MBB5986253.1 putative PurR-regulated permease PerM [Sphingobium lignivorans]